MSSSRATDSISRGDVFSWRAEDVIHYLRTQYNNARVRYQEGARPRDWYIMHVHETVIKVCLDDYSPISIARNSRRPVTASAQELVGPEVRLTDFYSAFGYIIAMSELDIHNHPGDERFHRQLVTKFAKLCWIMHCYYFFPESDRNHPRKPEHMPTKAFILFGPVGPEVIHLEFWEGTHYCSMSTSLPGINPEQGPRGAMPIIHQARQIRLNDLLQNVPNLQQHLSETNKLYPYPPGNCAEANPQARLLGEGSDPLKGLCVDIHKVGRCQSLEEVERLPPPGADERACRFCAAVNSCSHRVVQDLARPPRRAYHVEDKFHADVSRFPGPRR